MEHFIDGLQTFIGEDVCSMTSPRLDLAREHAKELLFRLDSRIFDSPVTSIVAAIDDCVKRGEKGVTLTIRRENASMAFQEASVTALPLYWECISNMLGGRLADSLLQQSVNDSIYRKAFARRFGSDGVGGALASPLGPAESLSADEANALRYMSGYIPYQILRKSMS